MANFLLNFFQYDFNSSFKTDSFRFKQKIKKTFLKINKLLCQMQAWDKWIQWLMS